MAPSYFVHYEPIFIQAKIELFSFFIPTEKMLGMPGAYPKPYFFLERLRNINYVALGSFL
jgi:hypothetical protein